VSSHCACWCAFDVLFRADLGEEGNRALSALQTAAARDIGDKKAHDLVGAILRLALKGKHSPAAVIAVFLTWFSLFREDSARFEDHHQEGRVATGRSHQHLQPQAL
jgi:hypothetical protein